MEKFRDSTWGRVDEFEIVDTFPPGYVVWNIGRQNFPHEGYIPLVKPDPKHEFWIIPKDMKALKCKNEDEALYIMKRASRGDYPKKRRGDGIDYVLFEKLTREYEKVCNGARS